MSEIVHFRPHQRSTIRLSLDRPHGSALTTLPIVREERFSMHSSKHASLASRPKSFKKKAASPEEVAHRFHALNPYVKNQWQTKLSSPGPPTPAREGHSFFVDASPTTLRPVETKDSARANSVPKSISEGTSRSKQPSSRDPHKSWLAISIQESQASEADPTSPKTPFSQHDGSDRWSWTNSQAPPTPRMYVPSGRSSIATLSRLRGIRNWIHGGSEKIDEERPSSSHSHKKPILKNQASQPVLAPPPPSKQSSRKPKASKPAARTSMASIFRQHPGTKVPSAFSPKLQTSKDEGDGAMEMAEHPNKK